MFVYRMEPKKVGPHFGKEAKRNSPSDAPLPLLLGVVSMPQGVDSVWDARGLCTDAHLRIPFSLAGPLKLIQFERHPLKGIQPPTGVRQGVSAHRGSGTSTNRSPSPSNSGGVLKHRGWSPPVEDHGATRGISAYTMSWQR